MKGHTTAFFNILNKPFSYEIIYVNNHIFDDQRNSLQIDELSPFFVIIAKLL